MLDEKLESESTDRQLGGVQLSISELFFITTLCALAFWIHVYVSPLIALMAGAILVFVLVIKQLGRRSVVIGGVAGFGVATILSWLVCWAGQAEWGVTLIVVLIAPCLGYVAGGFMTELADDGCP